MDFQVLGPLQVAHEGHAIAPGGLKQRGLLALLLLAHGEVVSRDRLIDGIWGERPPATAGHTLDAYVSRLRKILSVPGEPDLLVTRRPGYLLRAEPQQLDLARFQAGCAAGRAALAAGEPDRGRGLLRAALAEFSGTPLADLLDLPFTAAVRPRLEDARRDVLEDLMDAELASGGRPGLVAELASLVATYPLRERLLGQYLVALYRAGRQADALEVLRLNKLRMAEELGLEIGAPLRELEQAILRHDAALGPSTGIAPVRAFAASPMADPLPRHDTQPSGGLTASSTRERRPVFHRRTVVLAVVSIVTLAGLLVGDVVHRRAARSEAQEDQLVSSHTLAALDPTAGRLVTQVPLRAGPGAMIAAAGSLWVADPGDGSVSRVDPDRVRQVVDVGSQPSAMAAAGGSVWVANTLSGTVSRIDVGTDRVSQTVAVGNRPAGLVAAHGSLWVALTADHELVRLDARTGRVTARVGLDGGPTSLVLADRHLWTVSPSDSAAYRVSLDGKDVTRVPVGTGPTALAVAPGSVWVANTLDGTVSRIDCDRAVVTRSFEAGAAPSVLAMTRQGLWVADGDQGAVRRVDPTTGRTTAEVAAAGPVTGIVAARGLLWLAGSDQPSAADHRGGTLHIAATVPRLDSIDPAIAAMVFPPQLLGMTNDGLVTFAHTTGASGTRVVPDLATSLPTVSDHGRVYRFELRPGLTYSTGRPVLPGDIRRGIERDFRLDSPGAVSFAGIVGARRCSTRSCDLSQGIVVDARARSVTFHLRHADPDLIYKLAAADAFAVPAGTPTHDVGSHPVPATGPYQISEVRAGRSLTLTRNPRFHEWSRVAQPEGYPDRIVWRFGIGPQAAVTSVERGTADWALYSPPFSPPADRLQEIVTEHASQVHLNPLPLVEFFALHTREPPFDQPLVRRAVNLAVDRRAVVRLYGGRLLATPTCQILPPGVPGYRPHCPYGTTGAGSTDTAARLALARRLVARSGTRGMRVRVLTDPGFPPADYLVGVLRDLGYRASTWVVSDPRRIERLTNDSRYHVQVNRGGWAADFPSASNFLVRLLSCAAYRPADATSVNSAQFCSRSADRSMTRASRLQLTDPQAAARIWTRVDAAMTDRAVWVPTVNLRSMDLVSARVGNYQYHPQWGILLDQLWVR